MQGMECIKKKLDDGSKRHRDLQIKPKDAGSHLSV